MKIAINSYVLIGLVCLAFLTGCKQEGSMEKAGERADEIVDNVKEGDAPLKKKGVVEKTGEAIDDAVNGK